MVVDLKEIRRREAGPRPRALENYNMTSFDWITYRVREASAPMRQMQKGKPLISRANECEKNPCITFFFFFFLKW